MIEFVLSFHFLAQAAPAASKDSFFQFPLLLGVLGIVFYIIVLRPQNRERHQRQELLNSLKKNDKVITIGGLIGTVANLTQDGKEVTLKVDDNTKLRFLRSSIQTVVTADSPTSETPPTL